MFAVEFPLKRIVQLLYFSVTHSLLVSWVHRDSVDEYTSLWLVVGFNANNVGWVDNQYLEIVQKLRDLNRKLMYQNQTFRMSLIQFNVFIA